MNRKLFFYTPLFIAAIFVGIFLSTPAAHAIQIVQHKTAYPGDAGPTCTVNLSSTVAGDLLWGFAGGGNSVAATSSYSVTSTPAQTWTAGAVSINTTSSVNTTAQGFYDANIPSGITQVTFSRVTGTTSDFGCYVVEVSGVATSNPLDVQATSTPTNTTTPSTNVFTTQNADDIVLSGMVDEVVGGTEVANGNGILLDGHSDQSSADEYQINSGVMTTSTSFSTSPTTNGGALIAMAFRSASYLYSRAIVVTSTTSIASGTLANFPMLVSSTLSSWETSSHGGKVQNLCVAPNGGPEPCDLVFATSPANCNVSPLNFETESYTSSTGALEDWVNVPSLTAGTVIYVCYDNSSVATDQTNPQSTWNSNYVGVWHFPNSAGFGLNDSTANGNNGTNYGVTSSSGEIDGGASLNGSSYIDVGNAASLHLTASGTVSAWVRYATPTSTGDQVIVDNGDFGNDLNGYTLGISSGPYAQEIVCELEGSASHYNIFGTIAHNDNHWHKVDCGWNGTGAGTAYLYVDGIEETVATPTVDPAVGTSTDFGRNGPTNDSFLTGSIDDIQISNTERPSQWIITQFNNQSSPGTFYTLGNENSSANYAWGNILGWINFAAPQGNFTVTSANVTGYAWSQNFGWINLAPSGSGVTNDGLGDLQGYAWSQTAGWINFMGVTISSTGTFQGIASGTIAGEINFNCTYCLVNTSWRPITANPVSVSNTTLNNGSSIVLVPNATTSISVSTTITDTNGCSAITGGTTTVMLYRSGVGSSTCITNSNNRNCYVATAFTTSGTCSAGTMNATTTFGLEYFADATDASSSFSGQNWVATVNFTDSSHATSTQDAPGQELLTLNALNVTTSSINYGKVNPGSNVGSMNQSTTVQNVGNSSETLQISGTAVALGVNILATSSQHYATSTFTYGGSEQQLNGSPTTVSGFLLTTPTTTGSVSSPVYWGIGIPTLTASGTYSGTVTFTSLFSQ